MNNMNHTYTKPQSNTDEMFVSLEHIVWRWFNKL
jgi:hypothetical protein